MFNVDLIGEIIFVRGSSAKTWVIIVYNIILVRIFSYIINNIIIIRFPRHLGPTTRYLLAMSVTRLKSIIPHVNRSGMSLTFNIVKCIIIIIIIYRLIPIQQLKT